MTLLNRYRTITDRILGLKLVPSRTLLNRNVSYEFMNRQMVWHAFTVRLRSALFNVQPRVIHLFFQEFLLFLLPILNTRSLRRRVVQTISNLKWTNIIPASLRSKPSLEHLDTSAKRGRYYLLPENECAICAEDASMDLSLLREPKGPLQNSSILDQTSGPQEEQTSLSVPSYPINTPYKTSCGHVYCYVCISNRILRAVDEGDKYWECLRCDERITHASRREEIETRHGRRTVRSAGSGDSVHIQRRWGSIVSSSMSRLGGGGYVTSDLEESELLALDSVSSIGPRTHSGSDDLSD